ncbi:hypothetical protein ABGB18_43040 [Nonomuraea sp. B12E4]|uniref:hypothetical protein n=1 Tax=Nonomuraea sp. B12E4 TaxID=3153564 RepID=UPI00325E3F62
MAEDTSVSPNAVVPSVSHLGALAMTTAAPTIRATNVGSVRFIRRRERRATRCECGIDGSWEDASCSPGDN